MSWLFSQALGEEFSADCCSDGEPFAQWNVMPTPQGFWRNAKMIESSRLSQFGPTLKLLTADHGAAVLTRFLQAFPARTSALPAQVTVSMANVADYGKKRNALFAMWDRNLSGWKIPQCSLLADSELYSETWPTSGSMLDGECYQLQMLERPMRGSVFGLWATPQARDYKSGKFSEEGKAHRDSHTRGKSLSEQVGGLVNPEWSEWLMGWPIGWTDLKPLATDKFQKWIDAHF